MNRAIERIVDQLMQDGHDREASAIDLVAQLYDGMSFADLIALVRAATEPDTPLARVRYMDRLMQEFDSVARVLFDPPDQLAASIRDAVKGSVQGVAEMLAADQVVIDALRVPPTMQLQWIESLQDRFKLFWTAEPQEFRDGVQKALRIGLERGQSIDQIAAQIREQTNASRKRSVKIARQEIGNAASFAMRESQAQAGCTHYIWRATDDSRTRPEHHARNGKVFAWDDPPAGGHPGEDWLCRCVAIAMPPGVTSVDG